VPASAATHFADSPAFVVDLRSVPSGTATVTLGGLTLCYDGTPKTVTVATNPPGLSTSVTYAGSATAPTAVGTYAVVATVSDASYSGSATGTLTIAPAVVLGQTGTVSRSCGGAVTFSVTCSGGTATYQWQIRRPGTAANDGAGHTAAAGAWTDIAGAAASSFSVPSAQTFHAGSYRVVVTVNGISTTSDPFDLAVTTPPASAARLLNLSTRALCLTGNDVLIPGFVISGTGTKRLLLRAVGPELVPFGIAAPLPDPKMVLKLKVGDAYVDHATNDNWGTNTNATDIIATASSVYAFGLIAGSRSSALLLDLPAGQYTVIASDTGTGTGVGIVELYDADPASSGTRLINISNRGYVGTGNDLMIPGFVVSAEGPKTFLIRAVGPTLTGYGVTGALADPQITIFRRPIGSTTDERILSNDNWGENDDATSVAATATQVYAFALPSGSKDAAFVVTLTPAAYTVQATGVGNTTGVALVEVYVVP
jgi:hypothetical protein